MNASDCHSPIFKCWKTYKILEMNMQIGGIYVYVNVCVCAVLELV